MKPESNLLRRAILDLCSTPDTRVFRNNVGVGWVGRVVEKTADRVVLLDPRPLHAGLCEGSTDAIGWHSVIITPEMVGRRVAVFLAPETKGLRTRVTPAQQRFITAVQRAGGISGILREVEDGRALIKGWEHGD